MYKLYEKKPHKPRNLSFLENKCQFRSRGRFFISLQEININNKQVLRQDQNIFQNTLERSMEVKLSALLGNYDRQIDLPTNRPTNGQTGGSQGSYTSSNETLNEMGKRESRQLARHILRYLNTGKQINRQVVQHNRDI